MDLRMKWHSHEILKEWFSRIFSLSSLLIFYIFLKMYKWIGIGPVLMAKQWAIGRIKGYEVLSYYWSNELWPLVWWIPWMVLADIIIKRIWHYSRK